MESGFAASFLFCPGACVGSVFGDRESTLDVRIRVCMFTGVPVEGVNWFVDE